MMLPSSNELWLMQKSTKPLGIFKVYCSTVRPGWCACFDVVCKGKFSTHNIVFKFLIVTKNEQIQMMNEEEKKAIPFVRALFMATSIEKPIGKKKLIQTWKNHKIEWTWTRFESVAPRARTNTQQGSNLNKSNDCHSMSLERTAGHTNISVIYIEWMLSKIELRFPSSCCLLLRIVYHL